MQKSKTIRSLIAAGLSLAIPASLVLAGALAVIVVPAQPAVAQDDGPTINYGGALRYNFRLRTWNQADKDKSGNFLLDTFRLEADGSYKDLTISAEYRFYSGYHMLHHGYVGWQATDRTNIQLGVHQVPFGIQPYSSHNWFFDVNYYVGLEDDYDLGIKSITEGDNWTLKLAFYKEDEGHYTGSSQDSARYSYDLVNADFGSFDLGDGATASAARTNEEINQFNVRYAYTFDHGNENNTELGFSAEYGETFNSAISSGDMDDQKGDHSAYAVHMVGNYGRWNLHLAAMTYDWDVTLTDTQRSDFQAIQGLVADAGGTGTNAPILAINDPTDVVAFGAYDFPYWIAAEGNIFLFNVAYDSGLSWGPFENLTFYNNYSVLQKDPDGWEDSQQNVLGFAAAAGPLYCYFDIAAGKNHAWLGPFPKIWTYGLGPGDPDADWEARYNINIGYYF